MRVLMPKRFAVLCPMRDDNGERCNKVVRLDIDGNIVFTDCGHDKILEDEYYYDIQEALTDAIEEWHQQVIDWELDQMHTNRRLTEQENR